MRCVLSLGRGHRVWWTFQAGSILLSVGRHGDLNEFAVYQGDRVNDQGRLEVVTVRIFGWFLLASWREQQVGG